MIKTTIKSNKNKKQLREDHVIKASFKKKFKGGPQVCLPVISR